MQQAIVEILSGRRRGLKAALVRGVCALGEPLYQLVSDARNALYDRSLLSSHRVGRPVVSVGNLTTGGTGKSPLVTWLVDYFARQGIPPAVVSRGYRALANGLNDEALELAWHHPDVVLVHDRVRVRGAWRAVGDRRAQVVILDDGFQHRRLARDMDLVTVDACQPWGFGRLLPRGLLRERPLNLRRADWVIITRSNLVDSAALQSLRRDVQQWTKKNPVLCALTAPRQWLNADRASQALASLRGARALAFCGIGRPEAFRATLQQLGVELKGWQPFPDHHHFSADDLNTLGALANSEKVDAVVCTLKDLVKIETSTVGGKPLWALHVAHDFIDDPSELTAQLDAMVRAV